MKLSQFDFSYSQELVAQYPSAQRGQSKLLVAHRNTQEIHHTTFEHILDFLERGDCLVVNDTRVFKARLLGKKETGGKVEIFLLKRVNHNTWECLSSSSAKISVHQKIIFHDTFFGLIKDILNDGKVLVELYCEGDLEESLEKQGHIPLPPYIERSDEVLDQDRYQTIFAANRFNWGAVAAPTAGLHWTFELLEKAQAKGIELVSVTLHVGAGTFLPIRMENILDHKMHAEYFEISKEAAQKINDAQRIVAVGTTTIRALESSAQEGSVKAGSGWTDLFIYPGFKFQIVDALQTNFHQPKSSLLVMISAFAGRDFIFGCYQEAISHRYQLFSYGDTMLIV
ncbi:MAG: tRNA preQ1(34) S-adenosylmethionine ribosyltransferase-isomerase QueA [Deltaproteobacteria bacterium]|nr:tRNA preQ1(34) S-adenosylmethionine ribosyltransferase-isomerase QueA [Deltaproteobacteria bacterium]